MSAPGEPTAPAPPAAAPTPPAAPPAAAAPLPEPPPAGETPDQMRARLNAEAAAWRVNFSNEKSAREALEAQIATATTQSAAQVEAARAEGQQRVDSFKPKLIEAELKTALVAAGVLDPELVGLVAREGITIDDAGVVTGIAAAVEKFKTAKPNFFRAPGAPLPAPSSSGNPAAPPANADPTPANIRDMKPAEYRTYKQGMGRRLRRG